jgi:hypothetical protein
MGSVGPFDASFAGSMARVATSRAYNFELVTGARLSTSTFSSGWWLGANAVQRSGFRDAVERPRVETGGWHRIGNIVLTVSAARRNAVISGISRYTRDVMSVSIQPDTETGGWDSTWTLHKVGDSTRIAASQRWAETEAGLLWEGRRLSASLTMGGRLASHGVPSAGWASANVALRLGAPLALVLGAGNSAGGKFALDAEHRFFSLGFRVTPPSRHDGSIERFINRDAATASFAVEGVGEGRYRIALVAPFARRVDVSGDFTGWKALPLVRGVDGRWTLISALAPGTHRLNVRVDGGSWVAPPGLTTMSDDFAGEVGVLVIEPTSVNQ